MKERIIDNFVSRDATKRRPFPREVAALAVIIGSRICVDKPLNVG